MKNFTFFVAVFSVFSSLAFADSNDYYSSDYGLKPYPELGITVEYSAPQVSGGGTNSEFRTNNLGNQIRGFENIALGGNLRLAQKLGINLNWAKTELVNDNLQGVSISNKAKFDIEQYNLSALFYSPKVAKILEVFIELGISDIKSKLRYSEIAGSSVVKESHMTSGLYGFGFQITTFPMSRDAIRFSFQKYSGKLSLLDASYQTVRLGYVKFF